MDDHIYVSSKHFFGLPILVFLSIVLGIIALFAIMLGMVFSNSDKTDRPIGVFTNKYNLIVTHTNNQYGGSISSFANYNNENNAYEYSFGVTNNNSVDLKYSINFENTNYDFNKLDMSLIDYQLVKNGKVVRSGKLKNAVTNDLYTTNISIRSSDNYLIKLWSNDLVNKGNFSFKINIDA